LDDLAANRLKTRKGLSMDWKQSDVDEFRKQLEKGSIQKAYKALLSYMMSLRSHFSNKYGDKAVSSLYQGYMDMTFFALFPPALRRLDLKVAIVFNYDQFRFEAWLAARNRRIQQQYWELVKDSDWGEYRVITPAGGIDAIIACDLGNDLNLDNQDLLTATIDEGVEAFIQKIVRFFSERRSVVK
jgi:hypothetical protein